MLIPSSDVDVLLLCFAIDNKESLDRLKQWFWQMDPRDRVNRKPTLFALVGTKADQAKFREVQEKDATAFAASMKMQYYEVSSLKENGAQLKKLVDDITKEMIKIREFLAGTPKSPR